VNRRLGEIPRLHLQGWKISQARNQREASLLPTASCFLLGLFFDAEDGDNIFLRNVGWHSKEYMAS
jgi:hypothetical protein